MLTKTFLALALALGLAPLAQADLPSPAAPGAPAPAPAAPAPVPTPGTPVTPVPAPPPPPAGGGAQKQLDDAIKAYFAGEWHTQLNSQGALIDVQIVYRPDGSMSGTQKLTQYGNTGTYPIVGSYAIQAITDKRFLLTVYPQGAMQASSELTIVDQNTLFNQQANYYAYRVTQ